MEITVLFPVLNEKLRLRKGIDATISYMREHVKESFKVLILDNGSTDETPQIGQELAEKYSEVSYIRVGERGVGAAFRKGVEINSSAIVGYMDIDLSTDIKHLGQAVDIFNTHPEIAYINGTRFSKESDTKGRKWYRKITSQGLLVILHSILKMKATDAICGFTFMRKETAEKLVAQASDENGWFYMIELLLRAERSGVQILDMPVEWQEDYNTTVKIWKTIKNYMLQIRKLYRTFRQEEGEKEENEKDRIT